MELKPSFNQFIERYSGDTAFDSGTLKDAYELGQDSVINALRSITETGENGMLIWPIGTTQKLEELLKMFPVKNGGWCGGCSPEKCTGCEGVHETY